MYLRDGSLHGTLSDSFSSLAISSSSSPSSSGESAGGMQTAPRVGAGGCKLQPDSLFFPLVMRNCVRMGKFLVTRPDDLSLNMANDRRRPSSKRYGVGGYEEAADRSSFESTRRPSFTSEASNAPKSALDLEPRTSYIDEMLRRTSIDRNDTTDQASSTPFPHALADIMKALIWTAPDPIHDFETDKVSHLDLWQWLSQQLLSSSGILGSDLCMDIIRNIASR